MLSRIIAVAALAAGGALLARQMQKGQGKSDSHVKESLDVNVPVRVAYDQFTQFEEFPSFMDSVREVRQLDDRRLHWKATVFGKEIEWDAEITEQIPDQKIAWHSISGTPNGGTVTFQSLTRSRTRVTLDMYYEPQDGIEMAGDALGAVRMEVKGNLRKFKEMIEARGQESGAWRGTISPQAGTEAGH